MVFYASAYVAAAAFLAVLSAISSDVRAASDSAAANEPIALELESKISLGNISGRIDHLAIDVNRQRLYVAELGNDTIGVVDLKARKMVQTLSGFKEPQGLGYEPTTDSVYVANGGDGTVGIYRGADLAPIGKLALGEDADNVRIDSASHHVLIGHSHGALAMIDPVSRSIIADIALKGHPESFQIADDGRRMFVNIPDKREIAVIDSRANRQTASWRTSGLNANFPLAIDADRHQVLVVFRNPQTLGVFDIKDGRLLSTVDTCGDSDDIFLDTPRGHLYVSCGEGYIDVMSAQQGGYVRMARIETVRGARTALWVPAIDRLLLAVRASGSEPAAIWVYRPAS
jgi:DNA-binding beta-propeller fold protein YncE